VHWVWSSHGFLSYSSPDSVLGGALDFAGSGVVHLTGGVAALCGAKVIGARPGRFIQSAGGALHCLTRDKALPMPGHSSVLQALGTFILWMGWYGFNAGSTLRIDNDNIAIAARIFTCTTLSGASGGITACLLERLRGTGRLWDVASMCNGVLSGLVAITAGCATLPAWAAIVTGLIAGSWYRLISYLVLDVFGIDDPLDAFAVHGANGAWGVLAAALFSTDYYVQQVMRDPTRQGGLFYGGGKLLGAAFVQIICTCAWSGGLSAMMFLTLRALGVLRIAPGDSARGAMPELDGSRHLGAPYEQNDSTVTKNSDSTEDNGGGTAAP